jgi:hypothetical protein
VAHTIGVGGGGVEGGGGIGGEQLGVGSVEPAQKGDGEGEHGELIQTVRVSASELRKKKRGSVSQRPRKRVIPVSPSDQERRTHGRQDGSTSSTPSHAHPPI